MSRLPPPDFRGGLRAVLKAVPLGAGVGVLLRVFGIVPQLGGAILVSVVFSAVMWGGFDTLGPWLALRGDDARPPGGVARGVLVRTLLVFTALVVVSILLIRIVTGFNLASNGPVVFLSFLIGLCITALMSAFRTASSLAEAAQERARSEVARLTLEAENARKTQELEEARALQVSMLPAAAPDVPGFAVAFGMRTATEVGGDYYDWRIGGGGDLRLAVGDATGHGVRAGLLVVCAKTLFQTGPPDGALNVEMRRVSDGVRSLRLPRMNMALLLATLSNGHARIAAGGMPPALHFRAAAGAVDEILIEAPPPGQLARAAYVEREISLASGDRLLFFSDGLPECRGEGDDVFGYPRVLAVFQRTAPSGPQAVIDAFFAEVDAFRGARALDDDVTLVVVGVRSL
ncbi:MAG: SpoIIE family protein phosphatase [Acidobacteriota bacterium]